MDDMKIHIKAKKVVINDQGCIKLDTESMKLITKIAAESGESIKHVASEIIKQAIKNNLVVLDKEEE